MVSGTKRIRPDQFEYAEFNGDVLFSTEYILFWQIWTKKPKLSVLVEIWCQD